MTYPLELRENTNLKDSFYPVNLFRNASPASGIGRSVMFLHWHDHFELIYMTAGRASFHIDRQQYEAAPGDLLIVPSGGLHVGFAATEDQVEYWALVFNRSLLDGPTGDPVHDRYLSPYLDGKLRFPIKLEDSAELKPVRDNIRSIIAEYERKQPAYEMAIKARLHLAFILLARVYLPERENEPSAAADKRMERFKALILHIEANCFEKLSVSEAARLVHLTPYHFCNVFKAATGRTFVDYVNRLRMDEAEKLLQGGATVTEVADRVGCGNLNYFTRLFKKVKGMTPSEAKKQGGWR
ncbi:MAG: AraC family transcriptional regulator [Paenibacillaceae bacterium]|nr:AraC family transcriptional regulator [Paenibacillaceae bacterium]